MFIRKSAIVCIFIFSLLFISCSVQSGLIINGDLNSTQNQIEGNYTSFNGEYYKKVKLSKFDNISWVSNTETTDGQIELYLLNKDKEIIADLKDNNSIEIPESGHYFFKAIAKKHSGSFKVVWENNGDK